MLQSVLALCVHLKLLTGTALSRGKNELTEVAIIHYTGNISHVHRVP